MFTVRSTKNVTFPGRSWHTELSQKRNYAESPQIHIPDYYLNIKLKFHPHFLDIYTDSNGQFSSISLEGQRQNVDDTTHADIYGQCRKYDVDIS